MISGKAKEGTNGLINSNAGRTTLLGAGALTPRGLGVLCVRLLRSRVGARLALCPSCEIASCIILPPEHWENNPKGLDLTRGACVFGQIPLRISRSRVTSRLYFTDTGASIAKLWAMS